MNEQQRLLRLLKLISLLSSPLRRTARQYADLLEVNKTTVYRYFQTIEEAGYTIRIDDEKQHYLDRTSLRQGHTSLYFSEDEAQVLRDLVSSYETPLQQDLLNKIYTHSNLPEIANSLADAQRSVRYRTLKEAIDDEKQVVLRQYVSVNSQQVRDRRVEPVRFLHRDLILEAYDVEKRAMRHFRLERIGEVKRSTTGYQHRREHETHTTDPFRVADLEPVAVRLRMTRTAAQQMKEFYPATEAYFREADDAVVFQADVNAQFKLLDRLLLSLCNEVVIEEPTALKDHIKELWTQRTL